MHERPGFGGARGRGGAAPFPEFAEAMLGDCIDTTEAS
jgi:hypothetical protein